MSCDKAAHRACEIPPHRAFEVSRDSAGNVPPLPAIFPNQMAPVVRTRNGEGEFLQVRWGLPALPKVGNHPVTNVRNVS